MYNNGDIGWQIHDSLFDGNSNVCFISHPLREIRQSNKMETLPLKMKVNFNDENNWTGVIRLEMFDSM